MNNNEWQPIETSTINDGVFFVYCPGFCELSNILFGFYEKRHKDPCILVPSLSGDYFHSYASITGNTTWKWMPIQIPEPPKKELVIEVGKFYTDRDGDKCLVYRKIENKFYYIKIERHMCRLVDENGFYMSSRTSPNDLISEWED